MTEVVVLVVYHYYRFKLSLDDVVELMALRGFSLSHQTVHNWVQTFGVTLGRKCREKRKGNAEKQWNVDATENFFKQAQETTGITPDQITTDKEPALYPAIKSSFGDDAKHRDSKYKNNIIEQHHRGIKSRYKPMKGFKHIFCALIFCTAFEEMQQLFRMKNKTRSEHRRLLAPRFQEMQKLFIEAA